MEIEEIEDNEAKVDPRCPNCDAGEFVYRRIPEEKSRDIEYSRRKKLKIKPGIFHIAVIYCVNCGEVIGTAGGYYS